MQEPSDRPAARKKLPATVIVLGFASFFNDIGSEMAFPLLPVFLVSLGASPTYLGLVEGIADALASLLKWVAGTLADRLPRIKPLLVLGYALPCSVRPLLALASLPLHVLGIRMVDRVGKGLRTAPRDALIAASVENQDAGRAFGFHRAMDHAGGVLGPLVAAAALGLGCSLRQVFLLALIPSVCSLVAVCCVREKPREPHAELAVEQSRAQGWLSRRLQAYLAIVALFALANSSDAFLLLRAKELGVPTALLPMLWALLHVSRVASTTLGGRLADRFSRARLVAAGWLVFAACYLGLGFAHQTWIVWGLFALYGLHTGICEPAERALVRELALPALRGRAFGAFHAVVGACAIPAGFATGWVWQTWSASVALSLAAALAVLAAFALLAWERAGVGSATR